MCPGQDILQTCVLLVVGLSAAAVSAWWWWWRRWRWVEVGRVSQIWLYPLKSGRGWEVGEAECGPRGLEVDGVGDRRFMVVKVDKGDSVGLRQTPRMVLISITKVAVIIIETWEVLLKL